MYIMVLQQEIDKLLLPFFVKLGEQEYLQRFKFEFAKIV